jgi:RNA polymerase sigma-70 factor (ECF subfamily)
MIITFPFLFLALPFLFFLNLLSTPGDADLVERLKRRDPKALAQLYDRFGRVAYSVIFRMVRDAAIAEDLVQETFLRVWTRIGSLDTQKGSIGIWLVTIARNRALDYLRSTAARERQATDVEEIERPSLYQDLEKDILKSDDSRRIQSAMGKLSPNQRQVIELAYFEGLSQSEMAERMGQPLGTVKTWVRAALNVLRSEMGVAAS